jgi:hypothetical protein
MGAENLRGPFSSYKFRATSLAGVTEISHTFSTLLVNQHQLDTLFLVYLLGVNASTCFGRYSPIFRRLCTDAIWCNYVRRMCVDCVQVAVGPQPARSQQQHGLQAAT